MRPVATGFARSVIWLSVRLCIGPTDVPLKKRINRSRCCLEGWLRWAQETVY